MQACTILLRGASKDILNETERNLQDALQVARNIYLNPRLVPGGGAIEMAVAQRLLQKATHGPYRALAHALGKHLKTVSVTNFCIFSRYFRNHSSNFGPKLWC